MKYFVVSDIHSFGNILEKTLKKCGFNKRDKNHTLIVCGDIFDRGLDTIKVYNYLKSIPKKRCILIRGNHESLYFSLLNKYYPESHDFSNGTVSTFVQIAGYDLDVQYDLRYGYHMSYGSYFEYEHIDPECKDKWRDIKKKVKESEITKWLQSKQWINYYELDNYIFVHSFIPLKFHEEDYRGFNEDYCIYYGWVQAFEEKPNWRESTNEEWDKATWGCAYTFFDAGLFNQEKVKNKILVCGHYKCSAFNEHYLNIETDDIYYGKNLIAIDATTALSNKINVLIIDEDGKCYDQNGLLKYKKPIPIIETVTVSPEEYKKLVEEEYQKYANDVTNS